MIPRIYPSLSWAGKSVAILFSLLLYLGGSPIQCVAQVPRDHTLPPGANPQLPPGGLSVPSMGMTPAANAPVTPDTARVELSWPEGSAGPTFLSVVPDTVQFGEVSALICEFPAGSVLPDVQDLGLSADWLSVSDGVAGEHLDWLEELARSNSEVGPGGSTERLSLLIPFRVYRTDPFILVCGQTESPVIPVRGRTTDLASTAPIRGPRLWGWNLMTLAAVAAGITLFLLLVWNWWRRRTEPPVLVDWDPPTPAWIAASDRLRDLLDSGVLDQGRGREFLNELASIARGFAADRYRVPAREMTGVEIVSACLDRGFSISAPRRLARLIDDADHRRYDPELVDPIWCRKQAGQLIDQMSAVRIIPRQSPVLPEVRLRAEMAWTALQGFLSETGTRPPVVVEQPLSGEGA